MHAVSVPVTSPVADGLEITVQCSSFEDAKRSMEAALNEYVQSLLRKPYAVTRKAAA